MGHDANDITAHDPRILGRAIRALRHREGITQKELAGRVGTRPYGRPFSPSAGGVRVGTRA